MALVAKNLPANAGDIRDEGSVPQLGRSPGEGNGNPLQYSCLENPMNRGAWWNTACGMAERDATERPTLSLSLSRVRLFATPWTVTYQAPLSMGFSRQEYWSGLPLPSPGDLPDPGIEPWSPAFQADALT